MNAAVHFCWTLDPFQFGRWLWTVVASHVAGQSPTYTAHMHDTVIPAGVARCPSSVHAVYAAPNQGLGLSVRTPSSPTSNASQFV